MNRTPFVFPALLVAFSFASTARAFPHVVKPRETLAQIAEQSYGDPRREIVLVGANSLDTQGGSIIVAGMTLEVPAPRFHRAKKGETWYDLARSWLGDERRADLLATANRAEAWVPPVAGKEILIPAVITHICAEGDTLLSVWQRYGLNPGFAWKLKNFNFREGIYTKRGEILLVPLADLRLSPEGRAMAERAAESIRLEAAGKVLDTQSRAEDDLPLMEQAVRQGLYVEAVRRGAELLGRGALTADHRARLHRAMLEAYVALDAPKAAEEACDAWRSVESFPRLSPKWVSPKILSACGVRTP